REEVQGAPRAVADGLVLELDPVPVCPRHGRHRNVTSERRSWIGVAEEEGRMRVCLMIEGQEDVTWDQWLALAGACEEHGLEGVVRSHHHHAGEGTHRGGA